MKNEDGVEGELRSSAFFLSQITQITQILF